MKKLGINYGIISIGENRCIINNPVMVRIISDAEKISENQVHKTPGL